MFNRVECQLNVFYTVTQNSAACLYSLVLINPFKAINAYLYVGDIE